MGAHRGDSIIHRENTFAALKAADENPKYAFIEFDVQYTKDKQIVIFHDLRLLRNFGSLRSIGNTTFADLQKLTQGEIAAYSNVMDVLTKKLNIEIKSQGDPEEDERLADELIADIHARRRTQDIMISSISRDVITYINRKHSDIATGQIFWLTSSTYLHLNYLTAGFYEEFTASQADYILLHVANLHNIDFLLNLKPKDKTIIFWDFDDKMYLVHKNWTDRLWGTSSIMALFQQAKFTIAIP